MRFDLAQGPLIYVGLTRLAVDDYALFISLHHSISDEWSNGIFWSELGTAYEAITQGQIPTLADLPVQYADYAYWQRQWLNESLIQKQLTYWKNQLGDEHPLIQLPTDRPRPAVQSYRGALRSINLPASILRVSICLPASCQRWMHSASRQGRLRLW